MSKLIFNAHLQFSRSVSQGWLLSIFFRPDGIRVIRCSDTELMGVYDKIYNVILSKNLYELWIFIEVLLTTLDKHDLAANK